MAIKKHMDEANDDMVLKPDLDITFKHKSSIKRSEDTGIGLEDEKAIDMLEGDKDMDAGEAGLVKLFAKTKLHPDNKITYPDHASLKKHIVLLPSYMRLAAAAVIILFFSIGAWFIFSPEAVPDRIQHDLAILESISPEFGSHGRQMTQLVSRKAENLPISPAQREMVYIEKITRNDPGKITIPATLASTEFVLYTRPPNTQYPTPNTPGYAQAEPGKKTLMGNIFSGMFGRVKAPFEGTNTANEEASDKGFSIWDIAELGVKGVNALGDHDYTLVRDYNEKGNVRGLIVVEE